MNTVIKKIKTMNTENNENIACFLSGGVDSSIITALICEYVNKKKKHDKLNIEVETFCIGLKNSDDIREARIVANYLGTKHTEVIITEQDYMMTIPTVIQILETYDIATVRAGVAQYLLCKYVILNTSHHTIFTGDGADELMGGYLYMHAVPNMLEFDHECRNLLNNFHLNYGNLIKIYKFFNMTQKSPFLDQQFINYYLSIPLEFRYSTWLSNFNNNSSNKYSEKYLMRIVFSKENYKNSNFMMLLPEEIIWRTKEDFFDGISNYPNSVCNIISNNLCNYATVNTVKKHVNNQKQLTHEQEYYRDIFLHLFPNQEDVIHKFWKLKYITPTNEPSAHILDFYFDYNPEYSDRTL